MKDIQDIQTSLEGIHDKLIADAASTHTLAVLVDIDADLQCGAMPGLSHILQNISDHIHNRLEELELLGYDLKDMREAGDE